MKCPQCGSEGPPGLSRCRKCGHRFPAPSEDAPPLFRDASASSLDSTSQPSRSAALDSPDEDWPLDASDVTEEDEDTSAEDDDRIGDSLLDAPLGRSEERRPGGKLASIENSDLWREQLSERVETFRRRRARLRDFDPNRSLDFEFRPGTGGESGEADAVNMDEFLKAAEEPEVEGKTGAGIDAEADDGPDAAEPEEPALLGSTAGEAAHQNLDFRRSEPRPGSSRSLDLILGDEPWSAEAAAEPDAPFHPAPLGPRFFAALVDGLVLLLGGAIFGIIFWVAGGHVDRSPLTLAVMASIAMLLVLVYFGSFVALTSSTPGLLAMGLEVRTLDGELPTPADAALRAFGVVVSASALTLGFVWALVDSDSLTWHDRMSGTFITSREPGGVGD